MKFGENNKAVWSWCLYDWANSAFALTVMAAFFPGFFKGYWSPDVDAAVSTARLGFGNFIAGICIAVLSPVLGVIAGIGRTKKQFITFFILLGILMTACLYYVPAGAWIVALTIFILARLGFALANLFYDSMLIDVAEPKQYDFISSLGFAVGYLGCGILFILNLIMYKYPHLFGFSSEAGAIRFSFLIVAIWWFVFSLPLLIYVKPKSGSQKTGFFSVLRNGRKNLTKIAKEIVHTPTILFFFIAYFFYIDGVHTIVMMATDFGLSIGISLGTLMIALLCVQFIAFPAALGFGMLARKIGAKTIILAAISVYVLISLGGAWVISTGIHFIIFACITGTAQGAIQALSRSMFAVLIPENRETEFFGFYNMVGKFSIVLGPGIVALCNLIGYYAGFTSNSASRFGISTLAILFIIGGIVLLKVNVHTVTAGRN